MQSDALFNSSGDKHIQSDQLKPPDDASIGHNIDEIDATVGNAKCEVSTPNDTKSPVEWRRNSFAHRNGGSLNGLNSLIKRDALILLPEGGKNSATNGDEYPATRSSRNSDNENSDTDVSSNQKQPLAQ